MPDCPETCVCTELHTRAICDEVGERLRILLDRSQTPPPPKILALLLRLQLSELKTFRDCHSALSTGFEGYIKLLQPIDAIGARVVTG
jgi:hypothetical protein